MNTICGIEISDEHAQRIRTITDKILNTSNPHNMANEAAQFEWDWERTKHTNPHNTFKGTAREYIRRYLPEKMYLLRYLR